MALFARLELDRGKSLEWAVAARPYGQEVVSGDKHLVVSIKNGALIAVVDGLGHGHHAAKAADLAINQVRELAEAPLEEMITVCHERIRGTRGVAMTVARISTTAATIQWIGIGNVECLLLPIASQNRESAPLRGGVVGYQLPTLRTQTVAIASGSLLVFATDGLRSKFADQIPRVGGVEQIANDLLLKFGKTTDDVLVLVARLREGEG